MDAVSYSLASKQAQRIEKFIENPDSNSGVLTQPKVIEAGETVTIKSGRQAILADTVVEGDLVIEAGGEVFIPSGSTLSTVVEKVASTDNAIVRFDGTTGDVQNSGVIIDDNGNVGIGVTPSAWTMGKAIDIGNAGSLFGDGINYTWDCGIVQNGYQYTPNGWKYRASQSAAMYRINGNQHDWKTAPSGTAGNPITWDTAMTLGSNGNLLVGNSTDNGVDKLQVNGSVTSKSSQYKYFDLNNASVVNEQTIVKNDCLNIPYNDSGYVTISVSFANAYCMQTFVGLNQPARLFIRVMAAGNWSAWAEK